MALAGLDIGTSGCKFTILDEESNVLGKDYCAYEAKREGGFHELDCNDIWAAVKQVIRNATAQCPEETVEAFAVTTLGETVALLDKEDKVLGGGILYTDSRGQEECLELVRRMGGERRLTEITGTVPRAMYTLCKLMWVKKHSDMVEKADKILLMEDFATYMLTGNRLVAYSSAMRTLGLDVHTMTWSDEVMAAAGVDPGKFSTPVPAGTIVGKVKPELAKELGLSPDTVVCTGGHDQCCCALGAGVVEDHVCMEGTGTTQNSTFFSSERLPMDFMIKNYFSFVPDALPDAQLYFWGIGAGGAMLQWFRDNLGRMEKEVAKEQGKDVYQMLDAMVKEEPTGLLITPYFADTGAMEGPGQRASFWGMSLETKPIDIYKALMEGLAFEIRQFFELLESAGIDIRHVHASGGGAKSRVWLQIKADVTGRKFQALKNSETGTVACVMLSSVALGKHKDLKEAAKNYVKLGHVYEPDPRRHAIYDGLYEKYKRISGVVDTIMK
ncbi:FGGY-family carbohydrate kinase [Zongyangia hominis]|uniref:Carbohydrate kinase n=1 Tax=Zongyangia hominis TaxID=2763677 RepID=A0A926I9S3_9FIRM|nr:FGGY-family carbohydrate kinase [Zongyangia hominis]MBC8569461.1 hypothetical protein [Zongyangia hominis]